MRLMLLIRGGTYVVAIVMGPCMVCTVIAIRSEWNLSWGLNWIPFLMAIADPVWSSLFFIG